MTEALQKMVEAMAAEFRLQAASGADHVGGGPDFISLDGHFDLEKVARAGLEAIREPGEDVRDLLGRIIFVKVDHTLHAPEAPSIQAAVDEIVPRVIDEILKAP